MALTYVKSSGLDTAGDFVANSITLTANIVSGNANLGNAASANYFIGNGSLLTGLSASYANSNVAAYLPTYTGNIAANVITANTFIGDGSQLSGLPAGYTDSNVTTFLPNYAGSMTFTVGNIHITGGSSGQYLKTNGAGGLSWATPASGGGSGSSVTVSNVAPSAPADGDLWLDTSSNNALMIYVDPDWVSVSTPFGSVVDSFTGDGSNTAFTLSATPAGLDFTIVTVAGVSQPRTSYSLSSSTLTFSAAPPAGALIEVTILGGNATLSPVTITVANTVTDSAQPNIHSVGTLTSLTVSGNATAGYFVGNGAYLTGLPASYTDTNVSTFMTTFLPTYTGNLKSGNANLGNSVSANFYSGNGSALSSITGANVTGQVANSLVSGTVYTNAQPNITSLGTLTSLSVAGLLSETFTTKTSATGTVVHDTSTSSTFYHTTPSANFTANFTNVSTTSSKVTVVVLVISQGATPYVPTTFQIDGSTVSVSWAGGSAPTGNANKYDIISYSLLRVGSSWTVLGSAQSFG
jgi:hypothetical protein